MASTSRGRSSLSITTPSASQTIATILGGLVLFAVLSAVFSIPAAGLLAVAIGIIHAEVLPAVRPAGWVDVWGLSFILMLLFGRSTASASKSS